MEKTLEELLNAVGYRSMEVTFFDLLSKIKENNSLVLELVDSSLGLNQVDQARMGYFLTIAIQELDLDFSLEILNPLSKCGENNPLIKGDQVKGKTFDYLAQRWNLGKGIDRYRVKSYLEFGHGQL